MFLVVTFSFVFASSLNSRSFSFGANRLRLNKQSEVFPQEIAIDMEIDDEEHSEDSLDV